MRAMEVTVTLKPKIEGLDELEETLQEVQSAVGYVLVKLEEAKAAALRVETLAETDRESAFEPDRSPRGEP